MPLALAVDLAVALVVLLPAPPVVAGWATAAPPGGPSAPQAGQETSEVAGEAASQDDADADASAEANAALKRVLASGCRAGLADVYALVESPRAPWASTVLRLCGEILRQAPKRQPPVTVSDERPAAKPRDGTRDGRGQLVFWSGLYGGWLGIATDILLGIDGSRAVILPPMLGMGAGLTLSLVMTSSGRLTRGEAWTIITGLDYGSFNGALWGGGVGMSEKGIVGTSVVTSIAATAVGLVVADARSPSAGQIELCRSGLLWGTAAGFLGVIALTPEPGASGRAIALTTAITMDAGFLAGLGAARNFELSRNRVLIIDAGALGGTILGLGVVWLAVADTAGHGRLLAGGALVGLAGGLLTATLATRNLDAANDGIASGAGTIPAFLTRDDRGRWHAGTPAPAPILDPGGVKLVGGSLNAVAGLF